MSFPLSFSLSSIFWPLISFHLLSIPFFSQAVSSLINSFSYFLASFLSASFLLEFLASFSSASFNLFTFSLFPSPVDIFLSSFPPLIDLIHSPSFLSFCSLSRSRTCSRWWFRPTGATSRAEKTRPSRRRSGRNSPYLPSKS